MCYAARCPGWRTGARSLVVKRCLPQHIRRGIGVEMKAIRLLPAKHETPACEAYEDEREVRRFEGAMRVHRAYAEAFRVVPLDERVDGTYRVTSASGRA